MTIRAFSLWVATLLLAGCGEFTEEVRDFKSGYFQQTTAGCHKVQSYSPNFPGTTLTTNFCYPNRSAVTRVVRWNPLLVEFENPTTIDGQDRGTQPTHIRAADLEALGSLYIDATSKRQITGWGYFQLVVMGVALIWILVTFIQKQAEEAKKERELAEAAERKRNEERRAHENEQRRIEDSLANLSGEVNALGAKLPSCISDAERNLDTAEREFSDGAFAPFWDAVEGATTNLATFDDSIRRMTSNATEYLETAKKLDRNAGALQLAQSRVPNPSSIVERLRSVVRKGQKNFQFATIYEQRKTNKLLVSGFSTLGQALYDLQDRMHASLAELRSSVEFSLSDLASTHENVAAALEQDAEARRDHERRELEMLDNIQRRKKPN
jgi:hypothetical protein